MKIGIAQTKSEIGEVKKNKERHKELILLAADHSVDFIVFPELSLTGYAPRLATELSISEGDKVLEEFQEISDRKHITIGLGLPLRSEEGISIAMAIFRPGRPQLMYEKQCLHEDERPYFVSGKEQVILTISGKVIAPAICYESLRPEHLEASLALGAEMYLGSVAKTAHGMTKAMSYFPDIATEHAIQVVLCNAVGHCEGFEAAGQSSVWNEKGTLVAQLDSCQEGMFVWNTDTELSTVLAG